MLLLLLLILGDCCFKESIWFLRMHRLCESPVVISQEFFTGETWPKRIAPLSVAKSERVSWRPRTGDEHDPPQVSFAFQGVKRCLSKYLHLFGEANVFSKSTCHNFLFTTWPSGYLQLVSMGNAQLWGSQSHMFSPSWWAVYIRKRPRWLSPNLDLDVCMVGPHLGRFMLNRETLTIIATELDQAVCRYRCCFNISGPHRCSKFHCCPTLQNFKVLEPWGLKTWHAQQLLSINCQQLKQSLNNWQALLALTVRLQSVPTTGSWAAPLTSRWWSLAVDFVTDEWSSQ